MATEPEPIPVLPLFLCHKHVRAAQIENVEEVGRRAGNGELVETVKLLTLVGGSSVRVKGSWWYRHQAKTGGYFIQYADGYTSYSPKEAFESGYSLVEG